MSDTVTAPEIIPDSETVAEGEEAPDAESIAQAQADVAAAFPGRHGTSPLESAAAPQDEPPGAADEFAHLDPEGKVPRNLLSKALGFFREHRDEFRNQKVISVLDYSLSSRKPRFHVIDMASGDVHSLRMANGKASEPDHDGIAHSFSNESGSNKSCLGFVRTAETYEGKHGLSLRLDGLSSTNSNMRSRAVVVHGADYVKDRDAIQGRSLGCPAVPMDQVQPLISAIKGGSLMLFGLSAG